MLLDLAAASSPSPTPSPTATAVTGGRLQVLQRQLDLATVRVLAEHDRYRRATLEHLAHLDGRVAIGRRWAGGVGGR